MERGRRKEKRKMMLLFFRLLNFWSPPQSPSEMSVPSFAVVSSHNSAVLVWVLSSLKPRQPKRGGEEERTFADVSVGNVLTLFSASFLLVHRARFWSPSIRKVFFSPSRLWLGDFFVTMFIYKKL